MNAREIEDAGEEELIMKQVAEEDEWEEDDEEDGSILGEKSGEQRRLFKTINPKPIRPTKTSHNKIDSDEKLSRWATKGGFNGLTKRNQSFLLPR